MIKENNEKEKKYSNIFHQKFYRDNLFKIIDKVEYMSDEFEENSNAILLDGAWGAGKTIFINSWCELAKTKEYNVIYIDAFSADYTPDPFVLVASEIYKQIPNMNSKEKYKEMAINFGNILLNSIIIKGTGGAMDASAIASIIKSEFDEEESIVATTNKFKLSLESAVKSENKTIIVIDELDRCRPDFALRLLERVKHIFNVPNVIFLMVGDKDRLIDMVSHEYGFKKHAANLYLNKFFNCIEHPSLIDPLEYLLLCSSGKIKGINFLLSSYATEELIRICGFYSFSARGIKRLIHEISLVIDTTNKTEEKIDAVFTDICFLKLFYPDIYKKVDDTTIRWEDISTTLDLHEEHILDKMHEHHSINCLWLAYVSSADVSSEAQKIADEEYYQYINMYGKESKREQFMNFVRDRINIAGRKKI